MSFKNPMPMQPKTGNIQTFRVTCWSFKEKKWWY
jgi:hypothetical protein